MTESILSEVDLSTEALLRLPSNRGLGYLVREVREVAERTRLRKERERCRTN
jgi:hypothetical protein